MAAVRLWRPDTSRAFVDAPVLRHPESTGRTPQPHSAALLLRPEFFVRRPEPIASGASRRPVDDQALLADASASSSSDSSLPPWPPLEPFAPQESVAPFWAMVAEQNAKWAMAEQQVKASKASRSSKAQSLWAIAAEKAAGARQQHSGITSTRRQWTTADAACSPQSIPRAQPVPEPRAEDASHATRRRPQATMAFLSEHPDRTHRAVTETADILESVHACFELPGELGQRASGQFLQVVDLLPANMPHEDEAEEEEAEDGVPAPASAADDHDDHDADDAADADVAAAGLPPISPPQSPKSLARSLNVDTAAEDALVPPPPEWGGRDAATVIEDEEAVLMGGRLRAMQAMLSQLEAQAENLERELNETGNAVEEYDLVEASQQHAARAGMLAYLERSVHSATLHHAIHTEALDQLGRPRLIPYADVDADAAVAGAATAADAAAAVAAPKSPPKSLARSPRVAANAAKTFGSLFGSQRQPPSTHRASAASAPSAAAALSTCMQGSAPSAAAAGPSPSAKAAAAAATTTAAAATATAAAGEASISLDSTPCVTAIASACRYSLKMAASWMKLRCVLAG
jgi:hypothetical protein